MAKKKKHNSSNKLQKKIGISDLLRNACCIFTVLTVVIYIINTIASGSANFTTSLGNTAAIFALSFLASAATLLYNIKSLPFWESHLLVYIIIGAVYYLLVVRIPKLHTSLPQTMIAMTLYTIAFLAVTLVIVIVRRHKKKNDKTEHEKEYEPKF